jgi:hypothetical protein
MSGYSSSKPMKYSKIEAAKLLLEPPQLTEYSKLQKMSFPRYGDNKTLLTFQTPAITLEQYGVPSLGEYIKEDEKREYIKIPFDPNNADAMVLQKVFEDIDKHVEANRQKLLGKKCEKYVYSPLSRTPPLPEDDDEDDEDNGKNAKKKSAPKKEKFKYFTAKFDKDRATGNIKTLVFLKLKNNPAKKREQQQVKTMTDVANLIPYKSTVRTVIMVGKLWSSTGPDKTGKYSYGLGLKIKQIEVEQPDGSNNKSDFSVDAFIDDDEDDEDVVVAKKKVEESKNDDEDDEGDEESGSGEDESDEEEEPQQIVKPNNKPANKKTK